MHFRDELREKAAQAVHKKAVIGPDINLEEFDTAPVPHAYMADEDLCAMPHEDQRRLLMAGLDVTQRERGGTFLQKDTSGPKI